MPKVFFDASVLFSAIYSKTGGSYRVCQLVKQEKIKGFTTQTVVGELQANVSKFKRKTKESPGDFITDCKFIVRSEISEREIKPYQNIVAAKDAHILAGAKLCHCDYLLTLDKKHLNNSKVKSKIVDLVITSPGEFIANIVRTESRTISS
ncbi:hypothetical protein AUJ40_02750 [Candidatus Berkelbacteria bacterium CG1_02_42_45]|uniref:PIN domain-containing protein n=2 Tax=Candidatus Berkelbacteria TaxID=1618330 RepID=A0A2H0PZT2_9BACT|nr:MAG: hypothetical protein AUJ40_02750 [Candidatus Berkelbacteria bacterium CG1_02_42_45]PIR27056.1 MAG: hypothetical protein COV40_02930 [Candidatus Berkelbacteria bacterium CG11_big_fil_rev_8_21_14_0_20_42_15]